MTVRAITLELPQEIYRRAKNVAQATKRPIEQVVVEWIHPPLGEITSETDIPAAIADLDGLPDDQLIQVARATVSPEAARRLQELLAAQRGRGLAENEHQEAAALVEQEDLFTLRRARALFLLKQRGNLPEDLETLLG